jgi:hypothetical protein
LLQALFPQLFADCPIGAIYPKDVLLSSLLLWNRQFIQNRIPH